MRFKWADTLRRLDEAPADESRHFGTRIELDAPTMPTLTLQVCRWPRGWRNRPFRHTANTVYVVMQGQGHSRIGDSRFEWAFGDTFVAPGWTRIEHEAGADSVLCTISDEALMRWARYYRLEAME